VGYGSQLRGLLKTLGLVAGKAAIRSAKRAHETVVDALADKPGLASAGKSRPAMRAYGVERSAGLDAEFRARARTTPVCRGFMTVFRFARKCIGLSWPSLRSPRSPPGRHRRLERPRPRRPLDFRLERVARLSASLQNLQRAKSSSIARFDREIAAVTDELARLETPTDLDAALRRVNYGGHRNERGSQAKDNEP
jgi:hypothetical protein